MSESFLKWFLPYVLVQSLGYDFAKDSLNYSSPFVFMAARYLLAGGFLLIFARKFILTKYVLLIATVTSASTLSWIFGLEYVSPGDSAVLNSTIPLFAIPIAFLVLKERPLLWEIGGAMVGFLGVLIYSISLAHGSLLVGALLSLAGSATAAGFSVLFRKLRNEDSASLVGSQYLIGSIPFVVGSILYPGVHPTQGFFIDLAYMTIPAGAVQLYLWNRMLKVESVAKITTLIFAIPALTVAIQSIEAVALPSATAMLGAFVMFVGIYISSRSRLNQESTVSMHRSSSN